METNELTYLNETEIKHRMSMILDDLSDIEEFLKKKGLLTEPTKNNESVQRCINNIEICCDLTDKEPLRWTKYNTPRKKKLELYKFEGNIFSKGDEDEYFDLTTENETGQCFSQYNLTDKMDGRCDTEIYREDIEQLLPFIKKTYGDDIILPNPMDYNPKPITMKDKISRQLVTTFGFSVSKIDSGKNLTILEIMLDSVFNKRIRVILDDEGESDKCGIEVIGFTNTYIVEWKTEFGFNTPIQSVYYFIQSVI